MPDITAFAAGLQALGQATDLVRSIHDSNLSLEKAEGRSKLAEVISQLTEAKLQMAEVKLQLLQRDERIHELEKRLIIEANVVYEAPFYWRADVETKDGPYCQPCHDDKGKLIRLQCVTKGLWACKVCTSSFKDKSYVTPVGRANSDWDPFSR